MTMQLEQSLHVIPLLELARFAAEANDVLQALASVMDTHPELSAAMSDVTSVEAHSSEVGGLISSVLWIARENMHAIERQRSSVTAQLNGGAA